jgi:hypothetical protein
VWCGVVCCRGEDALRQQQAVNWRPGQAGQVSRHSAIDCYCCSQEVCARWDESQQGQLLWAPPVSTVTASMQDVGSVLAAAEGWLSWQHGQSILDVRTRGWGRGCHWGVGVAGVLQLRLHMFGNSFVRLRT